MPCNDLCAETCTGPTASDCAMFKEARPGQTAPRRLCVSFQSGQTCVEQCPETSFPDQGGQCTKCNSECLGCNGPTGIDCVECKNVRMNNECISECPALHFVNPDKVCQPCHAECGESCFGPSNSQCFASHELQTGTPVCRNLVDDSSCVSKCDEGHFPLNGVCQHCHDECSLAEGCSGPLSTDCVKCKHFQAAADCVRSCDPSANVFPNYAKMSCDPCHASCSGGCRGPGAEDCITQACAGTVCPAGQKVMDDCTCIAVRCPLYVDDGECVSQCPAGKYPDDKNVCQPCNPLCKTCSGPELGDCTACKFRAYFNEESLAMGSEPDQIHFVCVDTCPPWSYEKDKSTCIPCNPECSNSCTSGGPDACDACKNFKYQSRCVATCPAGTYAKASTRTCEPCNSECSPDAGCVDETSSGCNKCVSQLMFALLSCRLSFESSPHLL